MRFTSKREFVESVDREHQTFVELVRSVPKSRYREPGVWGDAWTIRDLLAHLREWEQMCLGWYRVGRDGGQPILPARGFKWNETPRLNQAIWAKHRLESARKVIDDFDISYQEIIFLIKQLSQEELLNPGYFAWT
ncbi:MAG: ClbS/DfsB family four-helix bundle protein [Pyrinomonadaceae bacterium]|nr:ClbS/DfsB family four-helix bundle protein [Pyrinomonadaceae bacterium]